MNYCFVNYKPFSNLVVTIDLIIYWRQFQSGFITLRDIFDTFNVSSSVNIWHEYATAWVIIECIPHGI